IPALPLDATAGGALARSNDREKAHRDGEGIVVFEPAAAVTEGRELLRAPEPQAGRGADQCAHPALERSVLARAEEAAGKHALGRAMRAACRHNGDDRFAIAYREDRRAEADRERLGRAGGLRRFGADTAGHLAHRRWHALPRSTPPRNQHVGG